MFSDTIHLLTFQAQTIKLKVSLVWPDLGKTMYLIGQLTNNLLLCPNKPKSDANKA